MLSFHLQLAREVLDVAAMMVKAGVTTEEIDHAVHLVRLFYCSSGVYKCFFLSLYFSMMVVWFSLLLHEFLFFTMNCFPIGSYRVVQMVEIHTVQW